MTSRSTHHFRAFAPVVAALLSLPAREARADVPQVAADATLSAADAASYDVFGYGMAASGTTLLVGSRGNDSPQVNSGAVYVFRRVGGSWAQIQKLVFLGAQRDDQVGTAVGIDGSVGVAGAPGRGTAGAAFVLRFDGGTWFSQTELADASAGIGAEFGASVACVDGFIAIGAPNAAEGVGAGAGRVRIFERSGQLWSMGPSIRAPFPDPGDRFGSAIAMSGDMLAVASPGDDDRAINSGAVYLYRRTAGVYQLVDKVFPPVSFAEDWFGRSVSLVGTMLVVGAYQSDLSASDAGAAFVYELSPGGTAAHVRTLLPPAGAVNAEFGSSVATDGSAIVVGAPGFAAGATLRGATWVFLDPDATADALLAPSGGSAMDLCGMRVAIAADAVWAASPGMQVGFAPSAGAVLLLDRTRDCNSNGAPDSVDVATGDLQDGNSDGIPDECQCIADLSGDGVVGGADLGLLLAVWGPTPPSFPHFDLNDDGFVSGADLGLLLSVWGPCP